MANIVSQSTIGVNLLQVDTTAQFSLGTTVNLTNGGQAIYVLSSTSAVSTYAAVVVNKAGKVDMVTTTLAISNKRIAFSQVSIATSGYGWVIAGGTCSVNVAAQCAPNVALFTTSTAGVLDDATITAACVYGVVAKTTVSNATATTIIAGYPHIGPYGGDH